MEESNVTSENRQLYAYIAITVGSISVIGLIANALLLYIFLTDKFFRKTTYYLMLICVISDGISNTSSLISTGILLAKNADQSFSMLAMCQISGAVVYTSYGISIMNLCLISIDRYFACVKPLNNFYLVHKRQILIVSEVFIWIISVAVTLPDMTFLQPRQDDEFMCDYPNVTTSISVYLVSLTFVYYTLPSMVIIVTYWRIIIFQRNYVRPGQPLKPSQQDISSRQKLIKSLISISTCHVLTTLPYFVVMFGMGVAGISFAQIQSRNPVLFALCMLAVSTTSNITVINPFLYLKFDGNIRRRLREMIKSLRSARRRRNWIR
ncbi:Alpha-1A adrenergic receptor [Trichoplax sp. H2]|nr:Alpha-1A adrenergic receptor [Trichoplax sp. H2]|eukprot:RDD39736.1 Alpha-1A adrenergic receptor [Trichoplax sp. H2]